MIWRILALVTVACVLAFGALYLRLGGFKTPDHDYALVQPQLLPAERRVLGLLRQDVARLAGDIGARNRAYYPVQLDQAAAFIEGRLAGLGYGVSRQPVTDGTHASRNVWARKRGRVDDTVVVGAHYDTHGDSPGADDNASGVAVLLSLAEALAFTPTYRSLEFVFFANEESPDYKTERMGSVVYADHLADAAWRPVAMINLESLGYYVSTPKSQAYPFPLSLIFRDVGDFVGLVANFQSAPLMHAFAADFRRHSAFPLGGLVLPQWVPGVDWSDQWRFWRRGIPALMVTDSALYRYPHYHEREDTPDKLDYEALTRIATGLTGAVTRLAAEPTDQ